jgi:hypothetical protein
VGEGGGDEFFKAVRLVGRRAGAVGKVGRGHGIFQTGSEARKPRAAK